jgi:Peptidase family M1 domain
MRGVFFQSVVLLAAIAAAGKPADAGDARPAESGPLPGPAVTLYHQLRDLELDPARIYRIRDVGLDRSAIHITLNSGTIAFSRSVEGHVTGAFFDGDGEILLVPPNPVERASMALFTGAPILEERFTTAFFRFNDDTFDRLQDSLRPGEENGDFLARWGPIFRELCVTDALELLRFLTWQGPAEETRGAFWHARLAGSHLGTFDVLLNTESAEPISVGQSKYVNGAQIFDVWASFPTHNSGAVEAENPDSVTELGRNHVRITASKIRTRILPSHELEAEAELSVEATRSGVRTLVFELSRYLKVSAVMAGDQPLEFIQNESLQGGDLARKGDDLVAVILPLPLAAGEKAQLQFHYSGSVMSEAGSGLLYVGARGIWYPNLGPAMSDFDLEFRYPAGWTLVATGRRVSWETAGGEQLSHWVSERPIPLAGFNLGKYRTVRAHAGKTEVEILAARGVEDSITEPAVSFAELPRFPRRTPNMVAPPPFAPAPEAQAVAQRSTRALEFFARNFGPFPFDSLAITQIPGPDSHGWPGLIFLSSYAFLNAEGRERLHLSSYEKLLYSEVVQAHETAHQWWGDAVLPRGYHDVWLAEALANYSALLALEQEKPDAMRAALEQYRRDLARKWQDGPPMQDAGPVTLGARLTTSKLPEAYEVVVYGRGTWLMHMLREMFRDADRDVADPDARFYGVLRELRERFDGRTLSTDDFEKALEDALPSSLRFEGKKSLAWFFDGWVNGSALPQFQLSGVKFTHRNGRMVATGTLLQKDAPDGLVTSVPLYTAIHGGKPVYAGRVFADGPETEFQLPVPAGARGLVIDPHETVLTHP